MRHGLTPDCRRFSRIKGCFAPQVFAQTTSKEKTPRSVIPAQAGIQCGLGKGCLEVRASVRNWIPAPAGTTNASCAGIPAGIDVVPTQRGSLEGGTAVFEMRSVAQSKCTPVRIFPCWGKGHLVWRKTYTAPFPLKNRPISPTRWG
jgi:hypothetical protein